VTKQGYHRHQTSLRVRNCCHCIRRQSQTAWYHPGEYVGKFDYFLQQGAHVNVANATRHISNYGKTWRHPQNKKYL